MSEQYRIDPGQGRFTVQAFATGLLSVLGHSPTFAVRDYAGTIRLEGPGAQGLAVELAIKAESLMLLDPVGDTDRAEIEGRMRRDVLESARFPEISFFTVESAADPPRGDRYPAFLGGRLTLHGVTQPQGIDVELARDPGRLRLRGGCTLRMSAYGIRPVSALGGAIKLKDELKFDFELVALAEGGAS